MTLPGLSLPNKPLILNKLAEEMRAAGLNVPMLGTSAVENKVFTYDLQGAPADLPAGADAVLAAHDGTPPAPIDYGADIVDQRDKIIAAIQNIRTYQGLTAAAVTQAQRKQYEDLIGNVMISLARRMLGNG